ncbi:response regulator [Comamonas piscis]|uniref:Response regulator n=1 Tax=Comamonas piscis TaxID=1562974 RepID=A0A7G5EK61_9BURK|nr:response regulator [Comamonas piscis]QMV74386.1 response regulator [Comamonas piscis]WSO32836.1 response regulator [Comamonas piscis]
MVLWFCTQYMSNSELKVPHVLIVDRDMQQLRLLVTALRSNAYTVSVIDNESQVYTRIFLQLPDLVLMDVQLPERHGIKAAKQLKDNSLTRRIPIIFISVLAEKNDRLLGLQSGAVDYILKPYYVDEVLERVRIHIALSRRKSPAAPKMPYQHAALESIPKMLSANTSINRVATEFIRAHISDSELKGGDVAASLGLSIHRLNIVFDAMAGMTVFEFIRQQRMKMAAELLKTGSLGVADIAAEVGYANSGNFSTEFKKFWKKSPKQYRLDCRDHTERS